jgi:hypothetical protein
MTQAAAEKPCATLRQDVQKLPTRSNFDLTKQSCPIFFCAGAL